MNNNEKQINSRGKNSLSKKEIEEIIELGAKDADIENIQFESLIYEQQDEFNAAKPRSNLTNDELEAIEKDKIAINTELARKQRYENAREYLRLGIRLEGNDAISELSETAKLLLDFLDQYETDPSSINQLALKRYKSLLERYKSLLLTKSKHTQIGFLFELTPDDERNKQRNP